MAELSIADRTRIGQGLMRYFSNLREGLGLTKADLSAAINATDTWINSNQASYNSALPLAAQSGLTATQKVILLASVALMRFDVNLVKKILGEVD